jgi:hypothetical protein
MILSGPGRNKIAGCATRAASHASKAVVRLASCRAGGEIGRRSRWQLRHSSTYPGLLGEGVNGSSQCRQGRGVAMQTLSSNLDANNCYRALRRINTDQI